MNGLYFAHIACVRTNEEEKQIETYTARINPQAVLSMEMIGNITKIHTITKVYETRIIPDIVERIMQDTHRRNNYISFQN